MASSTVPLQLHVRNNESIITSQIVVATGVTIPKGTLVSISGAGLGIVGISTSRLVGYAPEGGEAGDEITVWTGCTVRLVCATAAATMLNMPAYADDNQTVQIATPATAIAGRVVDWESGYLWVNLTLRA
jgi:hypothetical protein